MNTATLSPDTPRTNAKWETLLRHTLECRMALAASANEMKTMRLPGPMFRKIMFAAGLPPLRYGTFLQCSMHHNYLKCIIGVVLSVDLRAASFVDVELGAYEVIHSSALKQYDHKRALLRIPDRESPAVRVAALVRSGNVGALAAMPPAVLASPLVMCGDANDDESNSIGALGFASALGQRAVVAMLLQLVRLRAMLSRFSLGRALVLSCASGDVFVMRYLMRAGALLNSVVHDCTAMHCAAACERSDALKLLISAGAVHDTRDRFGRMPLCCACGNGNVENVSLLLAAGAIVDDRDAHQRTSLMWASRNGHTDVVTALLVAGAAVDSRGAKQKTSLMLASWNGHTDVVTALLEAGATVDSRDADQRTSLMWASANGHVAVVTALLEAGAMHDDE